MQFYEVCAVLRAFDLTYELYINLFSSLKTFISGPVFAVIVNKIGYRKASMLGSIIATTGFLLSYFASNLYHLYLTFGILQGTVFMYS